MADAIPLVVIVDGGDAGGAFADEPEPADIVRDALRAEDLHEGESFDIAVRYFSGDRERIPPILDEVKAWSAQRPVVLLALSGWVLKRAHDRGLGVPIVVAAGKDYAAHGLTPGENIVGVTSDVPDLTRKRMEYLRQLMPNASKLAILVGPPVAGQDAEIRDAISAAQELHFQATEPLSVADEDDIKRGFDEARALGAEAVYVTRNPLFGWGVEWLEAASWDSGLPVIHYHRQYVDIGGFAACGEDIYDQVRRAAGYVGRILRKEESGPMPRMQGPGEPIFAVHRGAVAHFAGARLDTAIERSATVVESERLPLLGDQ